MQKLVEQKKVHVVGAGLIGVKWVTTLEYFFQQRKLTIIVFSPESLGLLPDSAAVLSPST